MPLWPWLLLALARPSDAEEDAGARARFGGRLRDPGDISALERFLVGGGAWVLYAVFIVLCEFGTTTTTTSNQPC